MTQGYEELEGAKRRPRGECQVCGGDWAIYNGLLGPHHFELKEAGVVGKCFGVGALPYPAFDRLEGRILDLEEFLGKVKQLASWLPDATTLPEILAPDGTCIFAACVRPPADLDPHGTPPNRARHAWDCSYWYWESHLASYVAQIEGVELPRLRSRLVAAKSRSPAAALPRG